MEAQKFLELVEKIRSNTFTESKLNLYVSEFDEECFEDRLDDEQAVILAEALKQNTHITKVNLGGNHIGDIGIIALASANTIEDLDLNLNRIKLKGLTALAKSNLKSLVINSDLTEDDLLREEEMINAFVTNKTLESLNLTSGCFSDHFLSELIGKNTTIKSLALPRFTGDETLKYIGNNKTLKQLYIDENGLTDKGAWYIASNTTIESLTIEVSHISDDGAAFLTMLPSLKKLALCDSDITSKGAKVFTYSNLKEFTIYSNLKQNILSCEDANNINLAFCDVRNENGEVQFAKKAKTTHQYIDTTYHTEESPLLGEVEGNFISDDSDNLCYY